MSKLGTDIVKQKILEYNPLYILIFLFVLITIGKVILSSLIGSPQIFEDELAYDIISKQIFTGTLLNSNLPYPPVPFPPGYSFIINIAHYFTLDKYVAYHYILIINAILTSSIVFPSYYLLKSIENRTIAIIGALLISLLPSVSLNSFVLMSEALFIPLTLFSIWFVQRSLSTPSLRIWDILVSLSLITLFFTRAAGLSMIIAFIITLIWVIRTNYVQWDIKFKQKIFVLIFPGLALYIIWIADQLVTKGTLPQGYSITNYIAIIMETWTQNPGHILYVILLNLDYILLGSAIVFPLLALFAERRILNLVRGNQLTRDNNIDAKAGFLTPINSPVGIYCIITSILVFSFGITHMCNLAFDYALCGRYMDPIIPILVLGGIIGLHNIIKSESYIKFFIFGFGYLIGLFALTSVISLPFAHQPNNNVAIFYLYSFSSENIVALLSLAIGTVLLLIISYSVKSNRFVLPLLSLFILFTVFSSVPIFLWEVQISAKTGSLLPFCQEVNNLCSKNSSAIWDTTSEKDEWDRIVFYTLKFWLGDKVSDQREQRFTQIQPKWFITKSTNEKPVVVFQKYYVVPYRDRTTLVS